MSFTLFFKKLFIKNRLIDPASKILFDHHFFDLKYYLHQDSSNEKFSILLNITPEKLDQIAQKHYGSSFQILLNECRYRHLMDELESPINSTLSIESIFKLSGFAGNENFVDYLNTKNPKSS